MRVQGGDIGNRGLVITTAQPTKSDLQVEGRTELSEVVSDAVRRLDTNWISANMGTAAVSRYFGIALPQVDDSKRIFHD